MCGPNSPELIPALLIPAPLISALCHIKKVSLHILSCRHNIKQEEISPKREKFTLRQLSPEQVCSLEDFSSGPVQLILPHVSVSVTKVCIKVFYYRRDILYFFHNKVFLTSLLQSTLHCSQCTIQVSPQNIITSWSINKAQHSIPKRNWGEYFDTY